jgi:hypothetical protein
MGAAQCEILLRKIEIRLKGSLRLHSTVTFSCSLSHGPSQGDEDSKFLVGVGCGLRVSSSFNFQRIKVRIHFIWRLFFFFSSSPSAFLPPS